MDYESLLDDAFKKMPTTVGTGSRFEAPSFDIFLQGNQTIIRNFGIVCDKLRRDKSMMAKFLTKELAVPVDVDANRILLHRKINIRLVNEKLDEFIKNFVLCDQCFKPDTNLVDEHHVTFLVCEACGSRRPVQRI